MITTTVKHLLDAAPILKEISNYEFPAKVAFKIMRIIQASEQELKNFNNARGLILQKYGKTDEMGRLMTKDNNIIIKDECIEDYNKEIVDLLETSIDLLADSIEIEELANMKFTPAQLASLNEFIR